MNLNQVTLPASDLDASIRFYEALGLMLIVRSPHYARFECPDGEATLSVHLATGPFATGGALVYFECADVDAEVARLQAQGVAFDSPPTDQRWLWREARLRDPAGNAVCLFHAGANRTHPPWRLPAAV